ncbi:threonine/serine exporter family protein [Aquibacillus rhizosphaerae]|uniref:Threonine/serine exporter family protein n=1 Tax=Aquibacillus rhizosphaerae TaxID=3051431 RepID=A0ABT7L8B6_9BACI|nr:threonine/serine exporter family protein [Aquibacillus sp. LR5S19]MDL4842115.1 threonine/serine exporter family protein [Aquibacillus sp. LR5S19]
MEENKNEIIKVCLLAGKIMLQSGAETYRVEDTMLRIASSFGVVNAQSYATPTGIMFSVDETEPTNFVRILDRSTDLHKVAIVNSISRKISSKELTVNEASELLKEVEVQKHAYPIYIQILAASLVSGCFTIMFQGQWTDFIPALFVGGFGFSAMIYLHKVVEIQFFAEFLASLFIGLIAYLFIDIGIGKELDKIIIGSVMPLVPGLLITNAVRDLMAGHLVSGLSKGAEAFLTAFAIGAGVAVVFSFI